MDLLIGIGGTGQHVALAASRLMRIGALPPLSIFIVDADVSSSLTERLKTFGGTLETPYTEHPAGGVTVCQPFNPDERHDPTFADLFSTTNSLEREIFETLFEESSANVKVKEGFFGQPAVGVTVAMKYEDARLKPIWEAARRSDVQHIFVAASLTGGTGAGLVHRLTRNLAEVSKARVIGILYQQWFKMPPPQGAGATISDGVLVRNMQFGLDYLYRETAREFAACLLLGAPEDEANEKRRAAQVRAGGPPEIDHPLHAVAAYSIVNLIDVIRTEGLVGSSIYAAALPDLAQLYRQRWEGDRTLAWYYSRAVWLREVLGYAAQGRFEKELQNTFRWLFKTSPEHVGQGLHEAITRYPEEQRNNVIKEMQKTWQKLAAQYDYSLTWLDRVLGPAPRDLLDVRASKIDSVSVIQEAWRQCPVKQQEALPQFQDTAKRFHRLLIDFFASPALPGGPGSSAA